jgi:hypothetical protein
MYGVPFPLPKCTVSPFRSLVGVRTALDGYGIADPTAFAKKLQKAG